MSKRCGRCKHFLRKDYKHRFCLSCKRIINKAKRALVAACSFCQTYNGGGKTLGEHQRDGDHLCEQCIKKIGANNELVSEIIIHHDNTMTKPEVYRGKKAPCGLCEEMAHLSKHRRFSKPVCDECYQEIETRLKYLEPVP